MYEVTKTYGANLGLSATFRQWRATSHCRFLHGYSLEVKLVFRAPKLNNNNWVVDFGSLKPVKVWLERTFDHKTLVAEDDPDIGKFENLAQHGLLDLVVVPRTGCEGFAEYIATNVNQILFGPGANKPQGGVGNGVFLYSVEVREHPANSAIFYPDPCSRVGLLNKDCEPCTGSIDRTTTRKDIEDARPSERNTTRADSDGDDGA